MKCQNFVYILLGLFLASCAKEPIASFTASKSTVFVDEVITFTNKSTEATTYQWTFGDGTSSTDENPTHAYTTDGNFTVELTAINDKGSSSASSTISAGWREPVADFTTNKVNNTAEIDEIINFTNSSQNAATYSWSFGDGETSTLENPTHKYTEDGIYTVQLTATGPGGATNSTTKSITIIWPEPVASFDIDKPAAAPDETITFTNTSKYATSYSWDFGDGAKSTVTNPIHSYSDEGIYTIQLTATGVGGTHSVSEAISIAPPPVADFSFDIDNQTVDFTNLSENATSYSWDFGDGTTSTSENPTHSYSAEGKYTVQLTAYGPGGTDEISHDVSIIVANIFPGIGAMGIELEDTWGTIKGKLSNEEYLGYALIPGDGGNYVIHLWESLPEGVLLFNISVSASYSPSDSDILILLALYDNFVGKTEEGIMMGSQLSDLETAYGNPDEYDDEYDSYVYDRLGIRFYYNGSNIVDEMDIYPADSKKSTGIKYPEIDNLRNLKFKLQK